MDFANRTFKVGGEAIITTSLFGYPENGVFVRGNARADRAELLGR